MRPKDKKHVTYLSDPGIPGVRSMGPSLSNKLMFVQVREALSKMWPKAFGHCPFGGGSKPLPGWFGATFLGRICLILWGLDPCPDGLGYFFPR